MKEGLENRYQIQESVKYQRHPEIICQGKIKVSLISINISDIVSQLFNLRLELGLSCEAGRLGPVNLSRKTDSVSQNKSTD